MKHIIYFFALLISTATYSQQIDSAATSSQVFTVVEQMPEYPGGDDAMMKYIQKNIRYPDFERSNDIQGRVIVGFIVNEDGSISDVSVKKSVSKGIDDEAIRVVKLFPKFKPGMQKGEPVRVAFVLPIMFKLAGPEPVKSSNPSYSQMTVSTATSSKVYQVVEKMPQYPGGDEAMMKFMQDSIRYPKMERENDITGRVVVDFVVNEDGSVSDVSVKKSVSPGFDQEAVRVVRLFPKFSPGMQKGVPVKVAYVLPVVFKLSESDHQYANRKTDEIDSLDIYKKSKSTIAQYYKAVRLVRDGYTSVALPYLKLATEKHYIPALMLAGYIYNYGTNGEKSYDAAFPYFAEAADSGNAEAELQVGYMYEYGYGVDSNNVTAVKWYRKSAEQNNAIALCNLGLCYNTGRGGLDKNDSLVRYYFKKSAELGYARAQFEMGILYNYGRNGLPADTDKALMWYEMAAQQHHSVALNNYAWLCYLKKTNITKALRYSKESVDNDTTDMNSLDTYASLLFLQGEYDEAQKWQKKVISTGDIINAGFLERYGNILIKLGQKEEALRYWNMAMKLPDHSSRLADEITTGKYIE